MMMKMILLSLAGRKFSSSVEHIKHILAGSKIFPLASLRHGVCGVILYEDEPIPIIDLREMSGPEMQGVVIDANYLIVFQSEYGNVGLPVDSAVTIVDAEDGVFEDVAQEDHMSVGDQVFCYQNVSYPLLDVDAILAQLTELNG